MLNAILSHEITIEQTINKSKHILLELSHVVD